MATNKPCPGCGKVNTRRASAEVCHDCKQLIRDGNRLHGVIAKAGLERVELPHAPHGLPYVHHCSDRTRKKIQGGWIKLARAVGRVVDSGEHTADGEYRRAAYKHTEDAKPIAIDTSYGGRDYGDGDVLAIPDGYAAAACDVYAAIVEAAEEAYAKGKEDGQEIILQLAAGQMTVADFNEATVKERA